MNTLMQSNGLWAYMVYPIGMCSLEPDTVSAQTHSELPHCLRHTEGRDTARQRTTREALRLQPTRLRALKQCDAGDGGIMGTVGQGRGTGAGAG